MRIVFMGTPDFAVASLEALVSSSHEVVGVITAPDRPAGRGHKLRASAVKDCALKHDLPLLQPPKLKNPAFLETLGTWNADLFVVVAFRMLPEVVWDMPPQGTINLHGSLLPDYRGAAPIHWAVINGDTQTGATTFQLAHEIDTGGIIDQLNINIGPNDTTGDIHDRMMLEGAQLLVHTVDKIAAGEANPIPQSEWPHPKNTFRHAPKIWKDDARIDWSTTAQQVHNKVRGMNPFPGAWTELNGQVVKVHETRPDDTQNLAPGSVRIQDDRMWVGCGDNAVEIRVLQLQGKRRMATDVFLNGTQLESDATFV